MSDTAKPYVIVGGGVAGITAAQELAKTNAGQVLVFSAEPHAYYYRPRLTEYLAGEIDRAQLIRRPREWYVERGVDVQLGTPVVALDPARKRVTLKDGREVAYARLLLAMGSHPIQLPILGREKRGVFVMRTLEDAEAILDYAARVERAIVIGGGLLGLETARALRVRGLEVTVLEYFPRLLPRQLDAEGAQLLKTLIEMQGVQVALSADTQEIYGDETVAGLRLKDGRDFPAQLVVMAAGVRSDVVLAQQAGLQVERGVVVNAQMQTSAPDVYAAGDVAVFNGRVWAIAPVALAQAKVAAAVMAGQEAAYEEIVPSTTLKIMGIALTSAGLACPAAEEGIVELRRMDPVAFTYKKLVLKADGELIGAIILGDKALAQQIEALLNRHACLSPEEAAHLIA